jgi:hypothetical protein
MKEETLYDVVDVLNKAISMLDDYIESEAFDVEYTQQQLEAIVDEIKATLD